MSSPSQLMATIHGQQAELHSLREEVRQLRQSSYEEKYRKALRSIEDIIRANKQIKEELDAVRTIKTAETQAALANQQEEFRSSYDAVLREKKEVMLELQAAQLDQQKANFTISQLQAQVHSLQQDVETLETREHPQPEASFLVKREEEEKDWHRRVTLAEEQSKIANRNNRKLEQKANQLERKLAVNDKHWKCMLEEKELEAMQQRKETRAECIAELDQLRQQNAQLRIENSSLSVKLESGVSANPEVSRDWEAELLGELLHVRQNLSPISQQIEQMQADSGVEHQQLLRDKASLQTRVMQLQAELDGQKEGYQQLEGKLLEEYQWKSKYEAASAEGKKLEEEVSLLQGRIITLQSRQIAVGSRSGGDLEERVLQFETRIELLLQNKEELGDARSVGLQQLIGMKAYIIELDGRVKEMTHSNGYLLKKYKHYKEKYQGAVAQQKQLSASIATLNIKIIGYDKLVQKLQTELEALMHQPQTTSYPQPSNQEEVYRKQYEVLLEKLEVQQKYSTQELETLKLDYQTKIMELNIKLDQNKTLQDTIELYQRKNSELQEALSRKETEQVTGGRKLSASKASGWEQLTHSKQTKDIITKLQQRLQQTEERCSALQTQIYSQEENHKKAKARLEKELEEAREEWSRQASRREMEGRSELDQQLRAYKLRVGELEQRMSSGQVSFKDELERLRETEAGQRARNEQVIAELTKRVEDEAFERRRAEKQLLDMTHDKQDLSNLNTELHAKIQEYYKLAQENEHLRSLLESNAQQHQTNHDHSQQELHSKEAMIVSLQQQVRDLTGEMSQAGSKDVEISGLNNEIFYLKRDRDELVRTVEHCQQEISVLRSSMDANKQTLHTNFEGLLAEKDGVIAKMRRDAQERELRLVELEGELGQQREGKKGVQRQLPQLSQEVDYLRLQLRDKDLAVERAKSEAAVLDEQMTRMQAELVYFKESYQQLSYDHLERGDELSKLRLEMNSMRLKGREEMESGWVEQLTERDSVIGRLEEQVRNMQHTIGIHQEDKDYHNDIMQKMNMEMRTLRGEVQSMEEENTHVREQLRVKQQQLSEAQSRNNDYQVHMGDYELTQEEVGRLKADLDRYRNEAEEYRNDLARQEGGQGRMMREINALRERNQQLETQLISRNDAAAQSIHEINLLRGQMGEHFEAVQEREGALSRLHAELESANRQLRELEEEMEEREQAFSQANFETQRVRGELGLAEQEIERGRAQQGRLQTQMDGLKMQLMQAEDQLLHRNQQINRVKQESFALKMQVSDRQFEEQRRLDQELFSLRNTISGLEQQLEDKQAEIRHMALVAETKVTEAVPESRFTEEQWEAMREELAARNREMIGLRFDLEEAQMQTNNLNNSLLLYKSSSEEYQERLEEALRQQEEMRREIARRQNAIESHIQELQTEIVRLKGSEQRARSEESETRRYQQELEAKQEELRELNKTLKDSLALVETLEDKTRMQQKLVASYEESERERVGGNAQNSEQIAQMQVYIQHLQSQINEQNQYLEQHHLQAASNQEAGTADPQHLLVEIDRLNGVITEQNQYLEQQQVQINHLQIASNQEGGTTEPPQAMIAEIDRLNGVIAEQNQYLEQLQAHINHLETVSAGNAESPDPSNLLAEIDRLNEVITQQNQYLEQQQAQINHLQAVSAQQADAPDTQYLLGEIDRLNGVIAGLDEEIAHFKLKLSQMVNQEGRIEENLVTMVLMMAEIDALRDRIRNTESEIKSVRKSFIQATVENESNRSGPQLADMANNGHASSRDELEIQSGRKSPRHQLPLEVRQPTQQQVELEVDVQEPSGVEEAHREEAGVVERRVVHEMESKDRIPSVQVAHSNTEIVGQGSAQALHLPPPAMLPKASLIDELQREVNMGGSGQTIMISYQNRPESRHEIQPAHAAAPPAPVFPIQHHTVNQVRVAPQSARSSGTHMPPQVIHNSVQGVLPAAQVPPHMVQVRGETTHVEGATRVVNHSWGNEVRIVR